MVTRQKNRRQMFTRTSGIVAAVATAAASLFVQPLPAQTYRAIPGVRINAMAANAASQLGDISGAVQLTSGTFVIADNVNRQLHYYSAGGRFIKSVGQTGDAPGQFRSVRWVGECGRDSVYAYDPVLNRISVYSADGQPGRSFTPAAIGAVRVRCTVDGNISYLISGSARRDLSQYGAIQSVDAKGKLLYRSPELLVIQGVPLGKQMSIAMTSGSLVFGNADAPSFTAVTLSGGGTRQVPAGITGRMPTDSNRASAIEYWATLARGTEADHEVMRKNLRRLPPVQTLPPYTELFADAVTNAVWVKTSNFGDVATVLERVSIEGAPQGRATLPAALEIHQIRGDLVVATVSNPKTGVKVLVTYRLTK